MNAFPTIERTAQQRTETATARDGAWFSTLRRYLLFIAVANFVWEMVQLPLYAIWTDGTSREIAFAFVMGSRLAPGETVGERAVMFSREEFAGQDVCSRHFDCFIWRIPMNKFLSTLVIAAALSAVAGFLAPDVAVAKSDKEANAQLQECKKIADPKKKDECVSNVQNRLEKGKGGDAMKKGKGKDKK